MGNTELGSRLKQAREQSGMKQSEVCESAGIPKVQTLSAYERGVNSPPLETLKNLARLFGVSTDWLLFGECCAPMKEKTPHEYVAQLVYAADHLKMSFQHEYLPGSFDHIVTLNLFSSPYKEMDSFVEKWERLRELLDKKIIEQHEYDELMKQRLNTLVLHELSNELLPFPPYDTY